MRPYIAAIMLMVAAPATAETLSIQSADPAEADANDLFSLAVQPFDGSDGLVWAQAVEAELGAAQFMGRPYFRIIASESDAPFDGMVTGIVRETEEVTRVIEQRQRCVEYDPVDKKKCLKKVDVDIRCRRRVATVATTVRLIATTDGSVRYARSFKDRDERTICPDRGAPQSLDDYFAGVRRSQISAIRRDLAPRDYQRDIRVDESTRGLDKSAQAAFKAAVRLTKTDQVGACGAWQTLTSDVEPTAALAFNLGLCMEMQGDLDAATDWYADAQRQNPRNRNVSDALARVDRYRRALGQWNARKAIMGADSL